jgi:hypothetical protein
MLKSFSAKLREFYGGKALLGVIKPAQKYAMFFLFLRAATN